MLVTELGPFHNMRCIEMSSFTLVSPVTSSLKVWVLIPIGNPLSLGIAHHLQGAGKQELRVLSSCLHAPEAGLSCRLCEPSSLSYGT